MPGQEKLHSSGISVLAKAVALLVSPWPHKTSILNEFLSRIWFKHLQKWSGLYFWRVKPDSSI